MTLSPLQSRPSSTPNSLRADLCGIVSLSVGLLPPFSSTLGLWCPPSWATPSLGTP